MGPNGVTGCHVTTILTSLSSEGTLLVSVFDQFLHLQTVSMKLMQPSETRDNGP